MECNETPRGNLFPTTVPVGEDDEYNGIEKGM
jgi:hypothetical protein